MEWKKEKKNSEHIYESIKRNESSKSCWFDGKNHSNNDDDEARDHFKKISKTMQRMEHTLKRQKLHLPSAIGKTYWILSVAQRKLLHQQGVN